MYLYSNQICTFIPPHSSPIHITPITDYVKNCYMYICNRVKLLILLKYVVHCNNAQLRNDKKKMVTTVIPCVTYVIDGAWFFWRTYNHRRLKRIWSTFLLMYRPAKHVDLIYETLLCRHKGQRCWHRENVVLLKQKAKDIIEVNKMDNRKSLTELTSQGVIDTTRVIIEFT